MNPFDTAWTIVKMPIVPNSLRQEGDEFHAEFKHPETRKKSNMIARLGDGQMEVNMKNPRDYAPFDDEGRVVLTDNQMTIHTTGEQREKGQSFWPHSSFVPDHLQGKGRGTAMYDMAAAILDREKGKQLTPSNSQSDSADALWRKKTGGSYPFGAWPVRNDLFKKPPWWRRSQ